MATVRPARPWFRIALLLCGALNAILYAGLLPLWDGFDEPFHYGYVQYLRTHGSLPVLGRAVHEPIVSVPRSVPRVAVIHVAPRPTTAARISASKVTNINRTF